MHVMSVQCIQSYGWVCDVQDTNGKFILEKKKAAPLLGGQLILSGGPSPSDTAIDVSL